MKKWKKRMLAGSLGALVLLLVIGSVIVACKKQQRIRFVAEMGNGINLGNSLDSTNLRMYDPERGELEYETFWGNPVITEISFQAIKEAGFGCVRIPVTWDEHIAEDGTISGVWMERVAEVVEMALAQDLYVILNTHHEVWLNLEAEKEEQIYVQYKNIWTQIAQRFQQYDEKLLFEGMNEPRLRESEHEWDGGTPKLREMVNTLNQIFVETVREIGGENKERYLLICPYCHQTEHEAMQELAIPKGNVIVAVHMYEPYTFCQEDGGAALWTAERESGEKSIEEAFLDLEQIYIRRGIPVMITEFGCKDKNNLQDRVTWTEFYCNQAKELGISCIWWDNGSDYQLLDRTNGQWKYPELMETLTK